MPWDTIADKLIGTLIKKAGLAGPTKIAGIVRDSNHKPVPEVIVTIGSKQNTTAMSGSYIIIDPPTGLQSISLEYKGKIVSNVDQIAIEKGDKIELDLLVPDSLTEQLGTKQQEYSKQIEQLKTLHPINGHNLHDSMNKLMADWHHCFEHNRGHTQNDPTLYWATNHPESSIFIDIKGRKRIDISIGLINERPRVNGFIALRDRYKALGNPKFAGHWQLRYEAERIMSYDLQEVQLTINDAEARLKSLRDALLAWKKFLENGTDHISLKSKTG